MLLKVASPCQTLTQPVQIEQSLKVEAESRHSMRARLAIPIALLFLSAGLWGWVNPEVVSEWFDDVISQPDSQSMEVIGLQSKEEWLVVIVDFAENPSAPGLDVNQATSMLTGGNGLAAYLDQLSAGKVELNLTIHPTVIRAEHSVDYYGKDSTDSRDSGKDGSDGPAALAEQVVNDLRDELDWLKWDLDKDGVVDRFIILHTSKPQEDSGAASKIWSHFGPLINPVTVASGLTVEHYTMASFRSSNYRGTIIHESLHQHGAIDLYSVHDVVRKDPWNGVGDWDVMASGNWNGNGAVPALPMAATIAQLGVDRHQTLPSTWPEAVSCVARSFHIEPQTSDGQPLKIELSSGEYLWAEYRQDSGFDAQLPGEGLLVSIENTNVGGLKNNDANTDSRHPLLRIIEADQDDGLMGGSDEGSTGDVFQVGDVFGNEGVVIRNRFGFLVPWKATLEYDFYGIILNLTSSECSPTFKVEFSADEIVVFSNQSIFFTWIAGHACEPSVNLTSSDGREISPVQSPPALQTGEEYEMELRWSTSSTDGYKGDLSGTLGCGLSTEYDVLILWYVVGNIPTATEFASSIPVSDLSTIEVPLALEGEGSREYIVEITGALSRIATSSTTIIVEGNSSLELTIEPGGLLIPGMLAKGEATLKDGNGIEYQINITLTAESDSPADGFMQTLRDPGTMFLIVGILCACWVLLGVKRKVPPQPAPLPTELESFDNFTGGGPPPSEFNHLPSPDDDY